MNKKLASYKKNVIIQKIVADGNKQGLMEKLNKSDINEKTNTNSIFRIECRRNKIK